MPPEVVPETWTDADYEALATEMKRLKAGGPEGPPVEHKVCPDCRRLVATADDEGVHNTGACGCATSRELCWRAWNGNKCVPESPYAPEHVETIGPFEAVGAPDDSAIIETAFKTRSFAETARTLGITEGRVKHRFFKNLNDLYNTGQIERAEELEKALGLTLVKDC